MTQVNTTGANIATIVQATTQQSAGAQSQVASEMAGSPSAPFTQTNVSGTNQIIIGQASLQYSSDTPTAAQTAYASQTNGTGTNVAGVGQLVQQQVNDAGSTQDQEATQIACVTQDSPSGANLAAVGQATTQQEKDSAAGISQFQNQVPGPYSSCGSGLGTSTTTVNPNLAAFVLQNQNTPAATGQDQLAVTQWLQQLEQSSTPAGAVSQQQGPAYDEGGLEAVPAQTSTALSKAVTGQNERQTMQASTAGALTQEQQDPIHQPTGEGSQASNPNDTFQLFQNGTQQAGPAAAQLYDFAGDCISSGSCNVQQFETSNAGTTHDSCTASPCAGGPSDEPTGG